MLGGYGHIEEAELGSCSDSYANHCALGKETGCRRVYRRGAWPGQFPAREKESRAHFVRRARMLRRRFGGGGSEVTTSTSELG